MQDRRPTLAPSKAPLTPAHALALLVLALPGCAPSDPDVVEDDTSTGEASTGTGSDPQGSSGGSTASVDTGSGDAGSSDSGEEAASSEGSTSEGSSSTGVEVGCGDGIVDAAAGEECDGPDLAGGTCQDLGFTNGTLACGDGCAYDASGCNDLPAAPVLMLAIGPIKRFDFAWAQVEAAGFYRLEESAAPGEPFVQVGGDIVGESTSLAVPLHLRHQASYRLLACNAEGCTESAPVAVATSLAEAVGYVKASSPGMFDYFGQALAISGDGNTLAIGAPYENSSATGIGGNQANESASDAGAVYVLTRDVTGAWSQTAYVKASNTGAFDNFGCSVALSDDGSTLAVGAQLERSSATGIGGNQNDDSAMWAGAVYVFERNGAGAWSQQAYVKASNTDPSDSFGSRVALSASGDTLAVGAPFEASNAAGIGGDQANDSLFGAGAVYVFERSGSAWSQHAYVKASNPDADDYFGSSLALSRDGDTLAVGASQEDSDATGIGGDQADDSAAGSGAVYVFGRSGSTWAQQAYVKASNTDADDAFGGSLALSDDGDTLAVGALNEDGDATGIDGDEADDSAIDSGAAYVFARDVAGAWTQAAYVKATNTSPGDADRFGYSVALSGSGSLLVVGASEEDGSSPGVGGDPTDDSAGDAGSAFVLVRDGLGVWSHRSYVKAAMPGIEDYFGDRVVLSQDGQTLAVTASSEDSSATGIGGDQSNNALEASGAVYLY